MSLLLGFAGAQVAAGGPVTHQASVAFTGTGASSYTASLLLAASVAFGGTGTLSGTAILSQPAATTFTGTGTFSATAQLRHAATVGFNGAGTFTATPDAGLAAVTHPASVLFGGAGTFTAAGAQVHAASVNFAGVGTFAAQAALTHAASVAFGGIGTFNANAELILASTYEPNPTTAGGTFEYGQTRVSAKRRAAWNKALAESLEKPDETAKRPDRKPRRRPKGETPEERAERYRQLDQLAKELPTLRLMSRYVPEAEGLAEGTREARSARMRSRGVRTWAEPGYSTFEGGAFLESVGSRTSYGYGVAVLDGVHNLTDEQLDALLLSL